jgi:hypothetical protein
LVPWYSQLIRKDRRRARSLAEIGRSRRSQLPTSCHMAPHCDSWGETCRHRACWQTSCPQSTLSSGGYEMPSPRQLVVLEAPRIRYEEIKSKHRQLTNLGKNSISLLKCAVPALSAFRFRYICTRGKTLDFGYMHRANGVSPRVAVMCHIVASESFGKTT